MNILEVFSTNVRAGRKRLGLSQEDFAERCGLHRTYTSALERGKRNISLKNIQIIADALNVETYTLFIDSQNADAVKPNTIHPDQNTPTALDQKDATDTF